MLLPDAEALGLTHGQCLTLIESAEDTLDFLTSTLTFLIDKESKLLEVNTAQLQEWQMLKQRVFEESYALPAPSVRVYEDLITTYQKISRDLEPLVSLYMAR